MASVNAAAVRAADSLLRSVGGRQVLLRAPAPAVPGDDGEQLGLAVPQFQDMPLAPVVYRRVRPKIAANIPAVYELLISATAISAVTTAQAFDSAAALFEVAFGVLIDGVLMEITSATYSELGGAAYLYRLLLRSPTALNT